MVEAPLETLIQEAGLVVVGTVTGIDVVAAGPHAPRWTRLSISVDESPVDRSRAAPANGPLSVMLPGGSLHGVTTVVAGVPRLELGDRATFLLERVGEEWMPLGYRLGVLPHWGGGSGWLNGYTHLTALTGEPVRWATACLTYYLETSSSADLVRGDVESALTAAFEEWSSLATAYPRFGYGGATCGGAVGVEPLEPRNIILWREEPGSWEHPIRVVALTSTSIDDATGFIVDADVEFNGEHQRFAIDGASDAFDVRQIATHEVGHMLGLDHTPVEAAVMFERTDKGARDNYVLHADDVAGVEASHPLSLAPQTPCGFGPAYPQWEPLCPEADRGCAIGSPAAPALFLTVLMVGALALRRRWA